MDIFYLQQNESEVPATSDWLSPDENCRLSSLKFQKRRLEWLLGRWTAKRAVACYLRLPPRPETLAEIELRPEPDGAPELLVAGRSGVLAVSLSHRAGRAFCALAPAGVALGCDLELIEARTPAFVDDYFNAEERALVERTPSLERPRVTTLLWSGKESGLKAVGVGLRIDTRRVAVTTVCDPSGPMTTAWRPLCIHNLRIPTLHGWWCDDGEFVATLAADPPGYPIHLPIV